VTENSDELSILMRIALDGDETAYRKLLAALAPRVRARVRSGLNRIGRGNGDVEDVVQETLLAIHVKRHTWDADQPLLPWVHAIAHHKLVDHLRRQGFRQHLDIDDYREALAAPVDTVAADVADCMDLMQHLNPRQRQIVESVSIRGLSAREAGEALGMSEGAVRVALHRALKILAAAHGRSAP
jgi:RNA polymerase sigma-70 factor (ECF subfamily)